MKSSFIVVLCIALLTGGCSKLPQGSKTSFRTQICELVQMKDAGLISEEEYKHSRRSLLHRMLH